MAALLWSSQADWSADKIRQFLKKTARDLGPPGHDWQTGYGLIHLSLAPATPIPLPTLSGTTGPSLVSR